MHRSRIGYFLLLLAAMLLVVEALSILARFAMFAGASEVVTVSRWQWDDTLRLLGGVVFGVAGFRLLRVSRRHRNLNVGG